jgi:hypothetical protein
MKSLHISLGIKFKTVIASIRDIGSSVFLRVLCASAVNRYSQCKAGNEPN